jgi:hypothetical protein
MKIGGRKQFHDQAATFYKDTVSTNEFRTRTTDYRRSTLLIALYQNDPGPFLRSTIDQTSKVRPAKRTPIAQPASRRPISVERKKKKRDTTQTQRFPIILFVC